MGRDRTRYIIFQIYRNSEEIGGIRKDEVQSALADNVVWLFGVIGLATSRPTVVDYDPQRGAGIIAVRGDRGVKMLLSSLAVDRGQKWVIRAVKVAGTLKKARSIWRSMPSGRT